MRVGLIGWRGMVGSVLMDRMHAERDWEAIDPYFFSTSSAGGKAPLGERPLLDANQIDALMPMIYWADNGTNPCTDFSDLLATFMTNKADREVWPGIPVLDQDALDWAALQQRIAATRQAGAEGMTLFASAFMDPQSRTSNQDVWKLMADGPFAKPAKVPARKP